MSELEEKLERCFQAVFPELGPERIRTASAEATESWDSAALVTLMCVVEEEFSVSVDPEELEQWTSFAAICDSLRAMGAG